MLNLCRALAISQSKAMCGLTSQVLARDFKAGGHPDLISAAKLQHADLGLQSSAIFRNLLQSFAIFCNLLTRKMGVKCSGCNGYEKSGDERFFAPHPPTFCPHARYFAAYHHERALRAIPLFPLPTSLSTRWARDTRIMRVRHARKSRQ